MIYKDSTILAQNETFGFRPIFILNQGIGIIGGNGSKYNPYILEKNVLKE